METLESPRPRVESHGSTTMTREHWMSERREDEARVVCLFLKKAGLHDEVVVIKVSLDTMCCTRLAMIFRKLGTDAAVYLFENIADLKHACAWIELLGSGELLCLKSEQQRGPCTMFAGHNARAIVA
jgi:hypothetical protein